MDKYYADYVNQMGNFFLEHALFNPNDTTVTNAPDVLRMPEMRFRLFNGTFLISDNILIAHDSCIVQCQRLIGQIDKEEK